MAPTLNLFGLTLQTYPLILLLAVGMGLWLSGSEGQRLGIEGDRVYNLGFYALLATVLGARLAYVLSHWTAYRDAPLSAFSPAPMALAWPEGALIGGLVALVYWHYHGLPVGVTLDALSPGLALTLALERLGAFLGSKGFGDPTGLPWGIYLLDDVRHPVQLYEMTALLFVLGILWRQRRQRPFVGHSFALFVALYSGSRLFLEAFRARTPLTGTGVRVVQLVALNVMLGAVWYLYRRRFAAVQDRAGDGKEGQI
jgi:phosphatidylglycerol:prolipoprotein diacylglycerol transferase